MKKTLITVVSALSSLCLAACTEFNLFVVNAGAKIEKNQTHKDIIFSQDHKLALDIYQPNVKEFGAPHKVIVFFYGGSWQDGSKDQYKFVAAELAAQGYLVVIPDYRKYPQVKFPEFVQDGAQAVSWVQQNIKEYKGRADYIILKGHSAGAHTAALLAADEQYLKAANVERGAIKAVLGLSGPYAFTPQAKNLKAIFGPPEKYPQMRVPNFIDGAEPPKFLLHGEKDTTVGKFNAERLVEAIKENGGAVETAYYDNLDHIGTIAAFSWVRRNKAGVLDDIYAFLARLDKKEGAKAQ